MSVIDGGSIGVGELAQSINVLHKEIQASGMARQALLQANGTVQTFQTTLGSFDAAFTHYIRQQDLKGIQYTPAQQAQLRSLLTDLNTMTINFRALLRTMKGSSALLLPQEFKSDFTMITQVTGGVASATYAFAQLDIGAILLAGGEATVAGAGLLLLAAAAGVGAGLTIDFVSGKIIDHATDGKSHSLGDLIYDNNFLWLGDFTDWTVS